MLDWNDGGPPDGPDDVEEAKRWVAQKQLEWSDKNATWDPKCMRVKRVVHPDGTTQYVRLMEGGEQ